MKRTCGTDKIKVETNQTQDPNQNIITFAISHLHENVVSTDLKSNCKM